MHATIRPITAGDYDAWLPLWQGYQRFYQVDLAEDVTRTTFARFLNPDEPVFAAVAETADGALVGTVHWLFRRNTWSIADHCYLQDLFVAESGRGQRIGEALIHHVYAAARAVGAPAVYWLTHETNTTARRLYDRVADNTGFLRYRKMLGA
ncbi:MAG: GNAT family N-acetyltransferase [Alphaproteobacteria bacterium]|nr:GNAT family N-acetyltransferase [Alphaproteobacteria bacterium]TAD89530.1 MAG: GNAT family N-acetyltransferase [Alphaproteobacteria bacterium]